MGANEELDNLLPSTIQEMIGDQIMIKTVDGEERVYEVVSYQINHLVKRMLVFVWGTGYHQMK
ncbi:hypothetical protein [Paenibacillus sp. FSL R7-0272]|uniref:hypothetical protein n=1 Tax=Paenibacillus sp. FSL R7-0272 TaxID=2921679 RepID=UPI0030EE4A45